MAAAPNPGGERREQEDEPSFGDAAEARCIIATPRREAGGPCMKVEDLELKAIWGVDLEHQSRGARRGSISGRDFAEGEEPRC